MRARELTALGMVAVILAATAAWWALALWPLPATAPEWLARTRWVCFGSAPQGLPNGGGWLLLLGQPLSMLLVLWVLWGDATRDGFRLLVRRTAGRGLVAAVAVAIAVGLTAAGVRVARARERGAADLPPAGTATRLDRPAPPLALVDHTGRPFTLEQISGRPAVVAFAFAHCATICPLIVREVLEAQALTADVAPAVVIVTVDPWRDTPARLPAIARHWELPPGAALLSGPVADVERTLAAWDIGITRDSLTGDVTHPGVVYVLGRTGRVAYAASGDASLLARLLRGL
jgi:cytochrome oxidase Cu insertion factor (SCO1/SenC/PrrC family)